MTRMLSFRNAYPIQVQEILSFGFNLEYISNFAFEELGSAPLQVQLEATSMVRNGSLRLLTTRSGAPAFSSLCNHLRGVVDGMTSSL